MNHKTLVLFIVNLFKIPKLFVALCIKKTYVLFTVHSHETEILPEIA